MPWSHHGFIFQVDVFLFCFPKICFCNPHTDVHLWAIKKIVQLMEQVEPATTYIPLTKDEVTKLKGQVMLFGIMLFGFLWCFYSWLLGKEFERKGCRCSTPLHYVLLKYRIINVITVYRATYVGCHYSTWQIIVAFNPGKSYPWFMLRAMWCDVQLELLAFFWPFPSSKVTLLQILLLFYNIFLICLPDDKSVCFKNGINRYNRWWNLSWST